MIQMGFCGKSGKRLWVKLLDRYIIKPKHGVEQMPKIVPLKKILSYERFLLFPKFLVSYFLGARLNFHLIRVRPIISSRIGRFRTLLSNTFNPISL